MIYLDYAAATPLDPRVRAAMEPYATDVWANPSSIHAAGRKARAAIDRAREDIAEMLKCNSREIIFTSGGTESDNLALRGVFGGRTSTPKPHLIVSAIEHHAILDTAQQLTCEGCALTILPVDTTGRVSVDDVEAAIRPETKLISVMLANNEIGTIQPIREIGKMLQKKRERGEPAPLLHTDAVQAAGILDLDIRFRKVDLLSLSAHKMYGPKGIGLLYAKTGTPLTPQLTGGGQEHRLRAGTENVAAIVGMTEALRLATAERENEIARLAFLRDHLIARVLDEIPDSRLNGHAVERLPGNAHFSFRDVSGESLLMRLDMAGVYASAGSACTSGTLEVSHVLTAIDVPADYIDGSVRLSLGRSTTRDEIDEVVEQLKKIVAELRMTNR